MHSLLMVLLGMLMKVFNCYKLKVEFYFYGSMCVKTVFVCVLNKSATKRWVFKFNIRKNCEILDLKYVY